MNDLIEAKSKDITSLKMELDRLVNDHKNPGDDTAFYAVDFASFARRYPEFTTSCVYTFLKEMGILDSAEVKALKAGEGDKYDELNDYWKQGELIQKHDWDALFEGAQNMIDGKYVQWEKIYKKYYDYMDESLVTEDAPSEVNYRGAVIYLQGEFWMIDGFGESYATLDEAKKGVDYWIDKVGINFTTTDGEEEYRGFTITSYDDGDGDTRWMIDGFGETYGSIDDAKKAVDHMIEFEGIVK